MTRRGIIERMQDLLVAFDADHVSVKGRWLAVSRISGRFVVHMLTT